MAIKTLYFGWSIGGGHKDQIFRLQYWRRLQRRYISDEIDEEATKVRYFSCNIGGHKDEIFRLEYCTRLQRRDISAGI